MKEWFRRTSQNIKTDIKKDTKEGMWEKCPTCGEVIYRNMLKSNNHICISCNYHFKISSKDYIELLLDDEDRVYIGRNVSSTDPLKFTADKNYADQLKKASDKTGERDAILSLSGKIIEYRVVLTVLDFAFIGGRMGSVVGEVISRSITFAEEKKLPLIIISASGGARMQEGAISLMQLAKTSIKMSNYSNNGGLFISLLTNPTMGGASASFAMQGDIILAEPNALIGFAGQRVIKQTIGEDLPEGFQKSEFLIKKGFVDHIVSRNKLKTTLVDIIKFFRYEEK